MGKARNIADLLDDNGDVKSASLDNVPASNNASALTTGTLPIARIADDAITNAKLATGITASKLTGNLPAISGANLTGLFNPDGSVVFNESGADVDFRVESDTKVNAFTVNGATGRVGVNRGTDPDARLEVSAANETALAVTATVSGEYGVIVTSGSTNATPIMDLRNTNNASRLKVLADGRGLSQFTAKAWVNFNGTGTPAIRNSHNVSSITDVSVGKQKTNFTNQMANDQYSVSGTANWRGCVCGNDYDINYLETITGTFGGADAGADDYAYVHYSIFGD